MLWHDNTPAVLKQSHARLTNAEKHKSPSRAKSLSVTPQREGVVSLPGLSATSVCLVVQMSLVDTARLLASGSEATSFAMLESVSTTYTELDLKLTL
jgi:hypothetical protein